MIANIMKNESMNITNSNIINTTAKAIQMLI